MLLFIDDVLQAPSELTLDHEIHIDRRDEFGRELTVKEVRVHWPLPHGLDVARACVRRGGAPARVRACSCGSMRREKYSADTQKIKQVWGARVPPGTRLLGSCPHS